MKIALLGAGSIGGNLGRHFARAGHDVLFVTRHPGELADLVAESGERASTGTVEEVDGFGPDAFVLATPFSAVPALAERLAAATRGKLLIDAANPYPARDGDTARAAREAPETPSQRVAGWFAGARVVKAFNSIYASLLRDRAFPSEGDQPLVVPFATDDAAARAAFEGLAADVGYATYFVGGLADTAPFDVDGPWYATTGEWTVVDFERRRADLRR